MNFLYLIINYTICLKIADTKFIKYYEKLSLNNKYVEINISIASTHKRLIIKGCFTFKSILIDF